MLRNGLSKPTSRLHQFYSCFRSNFALHMCSTRHSIRLQTSITSSRLRPLEVSQHKCAMTTFLVSESQWRLWSNPCVLRHKDCYVAASGLPQPRSDHAVLMARFARQIMVKMKEVTRKLEVHLGPGTSELTLRAGFHSGPVTAGVMRGKRTRFQLFGDTV